MFHMLNFDFEKKTMNLNTIRQKLNPVSALFSKTDLKLSYADLF